MTQNQQIKQAIRNEDDHMDKEKQIQKELTFALLDMIDVEVIKEDCQPSTD